MHVLLRAINKGQLVLWLKLFESSLLKGHVEGGFPDIHMLWYICEETHVKNTQNVFK
jgi:hypothetical protein